MDILHNGPVPVNFYYLEGRARAHPPGPDRDRGDGVPQERPKNQPGGAGRPVVSDMSRVRPEKLGIDLVTGIVHYDSRAKHTYIWPLCGTEHLSLHRVPSDHVVTCVECLGCYVLYGRGGEDG